LIGSIFYCAGGAGRNAAEALGNGHWDVIENLLWGRKGPNLIC